MPQKYHIVATKSSNSNLYIYNTTKKSLELNLIGHSMPGMGLSWNPLSSGFLASGSADNLLCVWDVNCGNALSQTLEPFQVLREHSS